MNIQEIMSWKLDLDEDVFRIYDSKKRIAGYFEPDYGDIIANEDYEEMIAKMIKNQDKVSGGLIMVPLVKFKLFDTDLEASLDYVRENTERVQLHIKRWMELFTNIKQEQHIVRISHTDQDMLTITFPVRFTQPTPLDRDQLINQLESLMNQLQESGLL